MGRVASWTRSATCLFVVISIIQLSPTAASARVKRYGESLCKQPGYHCVTVGTHVIEKQYKSWKGVKTRKIKVRDTWENLWPDKREREIVMKVNRLNLRLRKGMTIAVPDDMTGKTYMDYAPFPKTLDYECAPDGEPVCRVVCEPGEDNGTPRYTMVCEQPCKFNDQPRCTVDGAVEREKVLIFDPQLLAWGAYDEYGNLVNWGPGSGGRSWCPDVGHRCHTDVGEFLVQKKHGRYTYSSSFPVAKDDKPAGGAPIPYFMPFSKGCGFHASTQVPGYNASHGCVRMFKEDARWVNEEFAEVGTRVIIKSYE